MKISEILRSRGLFANDIRQRFKNKQIKLNGEPTLDIELNVELNDEDEVVIETAGNFLFKLIKNKPEFILPLQIFDFETLSDSNINNELTSTLRHFFILRFSKKDTLVMKKID